MALPVLQATRYVTPLREGGSLPAILETEDDDLFVTKFRGAGQGAKALIAEVIAGLLAQQLELPIPDLAVIDLPESFGRTERDPEIQDILRGSTGLNVGLRYLEGALGYVPLADADLVDPELAADVVWLDAFVTNIDRTPRNPNLLVWQDDVYLIDHGAALYFHHAWERLDAERARSPFPPIRDHVLLLQASDLGAADERARARLSDDVFADVLAHVPDELLMHVPPGMEPPFETPDAARAAYVDYLTDRLRASHAFVEQARTARAHRRDEPSKPLSYRR